MFSVSLFWPTTLFASSWDPTLLVNTESFQTIDDSNTTGDIELRFGDVINEKIYWDLTPGRLRISDDVYIDGDLTASGTLSIEGAVTFGSTVRVNGVTYTFPYSDGSATGKVLKTSGAGVLSWSDDNTGGMSYADAASYFVNDTGDTMTGALNIVVTSGTPATVGLESPNTLSGYNLHASDDLSSSGGKVVSEGTEATDAVLILDADQGDDLADTWVVESEAADNDLSIVNDTTEVAKLTTAGAFQTDSNVTVGSAAAGIDYTITYDGETSDGNLKFFEDESQFQFDSALQIRGPLSASGHMMADGNLQLNADDGAVNTVLTFGSDTTDETLTFINLEDRFEFSDDLRVTGGLYSSGGLIIEDGQTFTIEGITYTFPQSDGSATGKVLKTSGAGVLSWSDDNASGGMSFAEASSYFINDTGDTSTGALTVNVTGGNPTTVGIEAVNTISGTIIRATDTLASSGNLVIEALKTATLNGVTYTYPPSDGSASGKVLKTSGAGTLSWSNDTRGGTGTYAMGRWSTFGYAVCGDATVYMGIDAVANCNATEATVDTTLNLWSNITVQSMSCREADATCEMMATLRKNTATPTNAHKCLMTNGATCSNNTGSVVFTNGDEIAILLQDTGTNCASSTNVECKIRYSW